MIRRPPRSTRTDTLFPYTTLFRSEVYVRNVPNSTLLRYDDHGREDWHVHRRDGAGQLRRYAIDRADIPDLPGLLDERSEEHTSELQSLMRISYAVFCLKKKTQILQTNTNE